MAYLRIKGTTIHYDESLPYLSIGVVGSRHEREIYDIFPLDPKSRLGHERRGSKGVLKIELNDSLQLIRRFLETRVFQSDNGARELNDGDRPAFERTAKLYREVISALEGR